MQAELAAKRLSGYTPGTLVADHSHGPRCKSFWAQQCAVLELVSAVPATVSTFTLCTAAGEPNSLCRTRDAACDIAHIKPTQPDLLRPITAQTHRR
jgi:hypothetical protein